MNGTEHRFVEAFKRMQYGCQGCGFRELIWNSRNGVTPFVINCRNCGGEARHVNWGQDEYCPDYKPQPGERIFRDGSPLEAEEIVKRRLEAAREHGYDVKPDLEARMLEEARAGDEMGEFAPGWPKLVEVAL